MPRRTKSPKTRALAQLHDRIRRCDRCPLHRTRTEAVPGAGPASARIMLVGEAPGRPEDLTGQPFVGAAGEFLHEVLAPVGLSRADVHVTNVRKARPGSALPPGGKRAPPPSRPRARGRW